MIGVYDYTVVLTYLGLMAGVYGMTRAVEGHYRMAILCLALCGLCDAFDGPIARTKKNRTDDQQSFGLQLDSLCDVICFGVFPAVISYMLGARYFLGGIAIGYYVLCSVIRLAFFNVYEGNRQRSADPGEKIFRGLPVTSISIILPLFFLLETLMSEKLFSFLLAILLFVVGTLFILDFKMKKPKKKQVFIMMGITGAAVLFILLFTRYKLPKSTPEDEIIDSIVAGELFDGGR
ncbi:MAG: CDP-alcohol phosphatidyltransferase family protein [Clostridia bacterium]|nr:CDP-alcohol phosphatidyltransferase family protein [Clostridia bacterium]